MKLTILAVTKMQERRICLAGINENGKWIRPVKDYPNHFEEADIFDKERILIYKNFNIIETDFIRKLEKTPHTEDYIINEDIKPKVLGSLPLQKREEFLISNTENGFFANHEGEPIRKMLKEANRSLILVGPVDIKYTVIEENKTPRIRFNILNTYDCERSTPCTDLKFIAFCKEILKERNNKRVVLNSHELKRLLKIKSVFLALGLGRWYEEKKDYYDLIIGFHTIPDYQAEIDYNTL